MRTVSFEAGALRLALEVRGEAHGQRLWSLPLEELQQGEHRLEWPARGDVMKASFPVGRGTGEPGGAFEAQREAWRRGELNVAPEAALALRVGPDLPSVWTGSWEVARGHRVLPVRTPTLLPATHTNAFLVGEGQAILIEPASGHEDECEHMLRWVAESEVEVVALLLTHHHRDHVGGARALADKLAAPLWAHKETAERCGDLPFARHLHDGEVIECGGKSLRVLHTPGHAPGHLCFLDEEASILIAGDMVAGVGTILIEPGDGDMNAYLTQLERLSQVGARRLLPSHGGLVVDGPGLLNKTAEHRRTRDRKVAERLAAAGSARVEELLPTVYDDVPPALWPFAQLSLLAHLEAMAHRGEAQALGGVWQLCGGSPDASSRDGSV